MRRLAIAGLLPLALALIGWGIQSPAFDSYLTRHAPQWAGWAGFRAGVGSIDFDLRGPSLRVRDLSLAPKKGGWTASARSIFLRLHPLRSLFGAVHLDLEVLGPRFEGDVPVEKDHRAGGLPSIVFDSLRVAGASASIRIPSLGASLDLPSMEVRWVGGKGTGEIRGGRLAWRGGEEPIRTVEVSASRRWSLTLEQMTVETARLRLTASGRVPLRGAIDASIQLRVGADGLPREWLEGLQIGRYAPLAGAVTLEGRLGGTVERPRLNGRAAVSRGRFGPLAFEGAGADLEADRGGVTFRGVWARTNLGSADGVSGRLSWGSTTRLEARGRGADFDLRPFMAFFDEDEDEDLFPVGLKASGSFEVRGPLHPMLALEYRVQGEGRDLDVTTEEDGGPITWFSLSSGKVTSRGVVRKHDLVFGPTRVDAASVSVDMPRGRIEYHRGLDFSTEVEIRNLALARRYLPEELGLDARGRAKGRLSGAFKALRFRYDVDLASTTVFGQDLGRLTAAAEFDLRDLVVKEGRLEGPLGRIEAEGKATLRGGGPLALDVGWGGADLAEAASVARRIWPSVPAGLGGSASVHGAVRGTIDHPTFDGSIDAAGIRFSGVEVDEAHAVVRASPSHWEVPRLALGAYGGTAEAKGSGDEEGFHAQGEVGNILLDALEKALGRHVPVGGVLEGAFQAQGAYRRPMVDLTARLRQATVRGRPVGTADLSGELRDSRITVRASAFGGTAVARGQAELTGERSFGVDFTLREFSWAALPDALLPEGLAAVAVSGEGRVDGVIAASPAVRTARWEGRVDGVRYRDAELGTVRARGSYGAEGARASVTLWGGEAALESALPRDPGKPISLRVLVEGLDLKRVSGLGAIPAGRLWARGEALVSPEEWRKREGWDRVRALADLSATGRVEGLALAGAGRAPTLTFRASSPKGLPRVEVEGEGLRLQARMQNLRAAEWTASAWLKGFEPAPYIPATGALADLGGTLEGRIDVAGRGGEIRSASGSGTGTGLSWGPLASTRWAWSVTYDGTRVSFEAKEPRGIEARGTWSVGQGLVAEAALSGIPLEGWTRKGILPADFAGVARGVAELRLPPSGSPSGSLRLDHFTASLPPVRVESVGSVSISYEDGEIRMQPFRLGGEGFDLNISGRLTAGARWDLKVDGTGDLAVLSRAVPSVRSASGSVLAEISVKGPWKAPRVEGPVEVKPGARAVIEGLDFPLEEVGGRAQFEANRGLVLERLDGQVGEGHLHLEGFVGLDGIAPTTLRLHGEARRISYEKPKGVSYQFDGNFLVTGTVDKPQVRAEITLTQLLYARRLAWKSMALDFLKRRPKGVSSAGQEREKGKGKVFVDLSVKGSEDIRVENNLADLDLSVDLRAKGYLPSPGMWGKEDVPLPPLWGRVEVRSGTIRLRSVEYEALPGTVDFLGETRPVPLLDLHAKTTVRQYDVSVDVSGPLDDYQVNLSSVPALAPNDLVALLTLGSTADELQQGRGGVTVGEATSFVTGGIQDVLESQVSSLLGFDQFDINPAYSAANQSSVPTVTVGKAITQGIFARYSAAIGGETEQNAEVQYTLNPKVQLLGTWSEKGSASQGSFGGEVRFRFTFR